MGSGLRTPGAPVRLMAAWDREWRSASDDGRDAARPQRRFRPGSGSRSSLELATPVHFSILREVPSHSDWPLAAGLLWRRGCFLLGVRVGALGEPARRSTVCHPCCCVLVPHRALRCPTRTGLVVHDHLRVPPVHLSLPAGHDARDSHPVALLGGDLLLAAYVAHRTPRLDLWYGVLFCRGAAHQANGLVPGSSFSAASRDGKEVVAAAVQTPLHCAGG